MSWQCFVDICMNFKVKMAMNLGYHISFSMFLPMCFCTIRMSQGIKLAKCPKSVANFTLSIIADIGKNVVDSFTCCLLTALLETSTLLYNANTKRCIPKLPDEKLLVS